VYTFIVNEGLDPALMTTDAGYGALLLCRDCENKVALLATVAGTLTQNSTLIAPVTANAEFAGDDKTVADDDVPPGNEGAASPAMTLPVPKLTPDPYAPS
jgi:hypothetical protein